MPTAMRTPFSTGNVTLTNANEAYQVVVTSRTVKISVYFATNSGFIADQGTEGAALAAADKAIVPADSWLEFAVKGSPVYLESATAGTVVYLVTEGG